MVDGLYNVILMRESRKGGTISPNTVIKLHWFLSGAYRYFVREGVCEFNPMLSVTKPERDLTEAVAFNESEFNVLSKALAKAVNEPAESREAIFRRNAMFSAYPVSYTHLDVYKRQEEDVLRRGQREWRRQDLGQRFVGNRGRQRHHHHHAR